MDPKALEGIGAFSGLSRHEFEKLAGWTFEVEVPVMSAQEFRRMEQELPAVADRVRSACRARVGL